MTEEGANMRTLLDTSMLCLKYMQQSIMRPFINVNNFTIQPSLLQMIQSTIQFHRLSHENLNDHVASFLEIYYMLKYNSVSDNAIRLRLFPFTQKDKAKA